MAQLAGRSSGEVFVCFFLQILISEEMSGMNSSVKTDVAQLQLLSKSTLNPERAENIIQIIYRFSK